jgi:hypothetical protein
MAEQRNSAQRPQEGKGDYNMMLEHLQKGKKCIGRESNPGLAESEDHVIYGNG